MDAGKQAIVNALDRWIRQRPGLEFCNYQTGDWRASVSAYRSEVRRIGRQLQDARALLRAVEMRDSITAADILAATSAYSGRLKITLTHRDGHSYAAIDYCTGQYWPTEYRAAVCAVLAQALWDWARNHAMPKPTFRRDPVTGEGNDIYNGQTAGEWLRRSMRREFGRGLQSRWLD